MERSGKTEMDWEFIIHHLISGSIPMAVGFALYCLILRMIGKKRSAGHTLALFVFCFYFISVLTVTGICIKPSFSPRIVTIPFADMIRGPVDTVLNILLFVPFGFFLPLLYKEYDSIGKIAFLGFLVSLSIEITQMFGFGVTDINDLITNTVGTCLGYLLYRSLSTALPDSWNSKIRANGKQCYSELLLFWAGSILIMLTIQVHIFRTLFASGINSGEISM